MNKEQIKDYLTDNLKIEINRDCDGDLCVNLLLEGEKISSDYIPASTLKSIVDDGGWQGS